VHQLPHDITGGDKSEVQLVIEAPVEHVWRMFTDIERWAGFTGIYDSVRWITPEPWAVGSYFEANLRWPVQLSVRHVVMNVRPRHEVRWLVHAIGIVIERWTRFRALGDQTEVTSSAIFFGNSTQELPGEVADLLRQYTVRFYEDFKAACERDSDMSNTA